MKDKNCYQIINKYYPTVLYYYDKDKERDNFINKYSIDWLLMYLKEKEFIEIEYTTDVVAGKEITDLIVEAINNQYFSAAEGEKVQE